MAFSPHHTGKRSNEIFLSTPKSGGPNFCSAPAHHFGLLHETVPKINFYLLLSTGFTCQYLVHWKCYYRPNILSPQENNLNNCTPPN